MPVSPRKLRCGLVGAELDYLRNRNTAVLLYNQLSDHLERKLLAYMINPYDAIFRKNWWSVTFCLVFSTGLDWFRPVLHNTYCSITAKLHFAFAYQF